MAAQKKLQKDSEYAHLDKDGDGIVTDEELEMDEKMLRLQDLKSDIENEDKNKPLSDSDIVEKLMIKDFLVARRTVAKYRKILKIKNANQRKEQ